MKRIIITALFALLAFTVQAQNPIIESVDLVRVGYWQVVSPDTITNHPSHYQALERQLNLLFQGVEANQIVIKPPLFEVRPTFGEFTSTDTVFVDAPADTVFITEVDTVFIEEIVEVPADPDTVFVELPPDTVEVYADTLFAYQERTLYPVEIDTANAIYYDVHESLRNIEWQILEDQNNPDLFRVRVFGTTTADRVSFASKCIGHDADMNLITQTESISLTPDANGFVDGETANYKCHPEGGNASMNTWLTARFDDAENVLVIGYIDIAHIRGLPLE